MNKKQIILISVLVLAFGLRFYKLGIIPALNADEASLGYDAYSLIKTGMDQHGNRWPLNFQSFNDYKPGLTVYLILPFIYLFGLNEWAVRVAPALLSFVSVYFIYLLVKELFKEDKRVEVWALMSAFLLAVSPWHVHFSRGAWEVNIATFFLVLGSYFFVKALKLHKYTYLSIFSFVLSLYTYHSARIIAPILGFSLVAIFKKDLFKNYKKFIPSIIVGVLLCVPLALSFMTQGGLSRAGGVALWADSGPENRANELRGDYADTNGIIPRILHNKPTAYTIQFLDNWSKHYWGEFLFLSGDAIQRNKVPETGQLYLFEIPLVAIGIWFAFKRLNKAWAFIFLWAVVGPIPAALTFQSPHALRAENMVIPLVVISGFGLSVVVIYIQKLFKSILYRNIIYFVLISFISIFVARYIHMYYTHMSQEYPFSSQYGVKELAEYLSPIHNNYEKVIVTDRYDQPYILFVFYLKYDPASFQKEHTLEPRDQYGFSTVRAFSNFRFESINQEIKDKYKGDLLVGTDKEILEEENIVKDIYGTNGYKYFRIVAN